MEDRIINIISDVCDSETIRNDIKIDLIESGLLDSLAFITLLSRLEDEFDIEIQPTQIEPNTWRSVEDIIELVKRYNI